MNPCQGAHRWAFNGFDRLNRDSEEEEVVRVDRCLDCNGRRTALPDGRAFFRGQRIDIGTAELAADLQALRTELREEVTP
jgi:hypothetical protein